MFISDTRAKSCHIPISMEHCIRIACSLLVAENHSSLACLALSITCAAKSSLLSHNFKYMRLLTHSIRSMQNIERFCTIHTTLCNNPYVSSAPTLNGHRASHKNMPRVLHRIGTEDAFHRMQHASFLEFRSGWQQSLAPLHKKIFIFCGKAILHIKFQSP